MISDVPTESSTGICHERFRIRGQPTGYVTPTVIHKRWGNESIYYNDLYCLKTITINPFSRTSMHMHLHKHEHLMIQSGRLIFKFKDREGINREEELTPGDAWCIPPGMIHQLINETDVPVIIVEASTTDHPEDSIRIEK